MKIGIVNNCLRGETRVAATPQTVAMMKKDGFEVLAEKGLGILSSFCDELYQKAGAVLENRDNVLKADIILSVVPPKKTDLHFFKSGQWLICNLTSFDDKADMQDLVATDIGVIDLAKMPRISRAQPMDILSSQALIAGYKAATDALYYLRKTAPLMITSFGTLFAAKAVVVGAGLKGLQAASVLKRMGATVFVNDIRKESKAEIESVGAKFICSVTEYLKDADILITSAVSDGKKAPRLIHADDIQTMAQNAVVIDMAEGNVEEGFKRGDITFLKDKYYERKLPFSASTLFANNVLSFLRTFNYLENLDFHDEIIRNVTTCSEGFLIKVR